jgi:hypothetical protein
MVMITTRRTVRDVPRSQSSFKGSQNLLHLLSCLSPSLLSNRLNWSSMINLLPPLPPTYLCVMVIQIRITTHLRPMPKINLLLRRNLMIHHHHCLKNLPRFHLPPVLFISNKRISIQSSALPPMLVVEPNYLLDSKVLSFSRVYTP